MVAGGIISTTQKNAEQFYLFHNFFHKTLILNFFGQIVNATFWI